MSVAWMRRIGGMAAVVGLAVVVYWPALDGRPLWDDDGHLTAPALRSWAGLWRIWMEPGATQQYYPLLHSAFWLEHRLWGDDVRGYHLANLGQHLLAAGLFGLLLRRLGLRGAGLAAAAFALHPVHVESVAWISEQKNTLALVFYLGAALAHLRFDETRRRRDYAAASALFAAALLTKTMTATLPGALLVVMWWRRGKLGYRDVMPLLPWFIVGAVAGLYTAAVERHLIGAAGPEFSPDGVERLLLAGQVTWFYLGNVLWPANQVFIYPRWEIGATRVGAWMPLIAAVALTVAMWRGRRWSRGPLAAWLIFGGTLFPVLGFFAVYPFRYSWVADHFQYFANLAPIAAVAAGAATMTFARRRTRVAAAGMALAGLAVLSARQTPHYRDATALFRATLLRNPECWMAHNNLGLIASARGEKREALLHFRQAVALAPGYFGGHNNLGLTLTQTGHPAAALPHLRRAVALEPNAGRGHNNLGIALAALRRPVEAVGAFRVAAHLMPDSASAQENLAKGLRLAGRLSEAEAASARAVRLREHVRR